MSKFGKSNKIIYLWRQVLVLFLLPMSLTACNSDRSEQTGSRTNEDYVYVLEMIDLENIEGLSPYDVKVFGDSLYYTRTETGDAAETNKRYLCEYSLTEKKVMREMLLGEGSGSLKYFQVMEDGGIYVLDTHYDLISTNYATGSLLIKYDSQGELIQQVNLDDVGIRVTPQSMAVDANGRAYLQQNDKLILLEADGSLSGEVDLEQEAGNFTMGSGLGRDGRVYVYGALSGSGMTVSFGMAEVLFEEQRLGSVQEGLPVSIQAADLVPGVSYDFLINDGTSLYGYSLAEQSAEEILKWRDCDISGSSVYSYSEITGDRILVCLNEKNGQIQMAALVRKDPAETPEKTEIVVGMLGGIVDTELEDAVAAFNRQSDSVHVTLREYSYTGSTTTELIEELQRQRTQIYLDILTGDGMDLLSLRDLSADTLTANGCLEDLSPYLERSNVLDREDYLENVLDAYTFGGKLVSIPYNVYITTLAGPAAELGEEPGWTIEELMAYVEANPDVQLQDPISKANFLTLCLKFGSDRFIDWDTNICSFDSDEFKQLLSFADSHFSQEIVYGDYTEIVDRIHDGRLLLTQVTISDFTRVQPYGEIYDGGAVFIGYPTADGSNGASLDSNSAYSIVTTSEHKEAAWSFLEYYLSREQDNGTYSLPTNRKALEAQMNSLMEVRYLTDENGEPILDSQGNPKEDNIYQGVSIYGKHFDGHRLTEEEASMVMKLLETGSFSSPVSDTAVSNIISEETGAYFQGQKTLDETAELIQRRVQLYLDEIK